MSGFGGRLGEVLMELDLTTRTAAERIGTSKANVSRWLAGTVEPKIGQAEQVARALLVSVGWLVAGEGPKWSALVQVNPDAMAIRAAALREAVQVLERLAEAPAVASANPRVAKDAAAREADAAVRARGARQAKRRGG